MGYVVTTVKMRYSYASGMDEFLCDTPIQYCETKEQAEKILNLFDHFYSEVLRVIPESELNDEWQPTYKFEE
jgi:hypothetical protein